MSKSNNKPACNELSKLNISRKLKDSQVRDSSSTMKSFQKQFREDVQNKAIHNMAYVTLMTKESELFRVITLVCVLRKLTEVSNIDIVVMVTTNIGIKTRSILKRYSNVVTEVEKLPWKRTKFHALGLVTYDKVLYIANNMILGKSIEDLFDLDSPAGVVTIFKERAQDSWHGVLCRPDDVKTALRYSHGVKTSILLLKPNQMEHLKIQTGSQDKSQKHFISLDTQFISTFYQNKWTHIHNKYAFYPWLSSINYIPLCYDMGSHEPEDQLNSDIEKLGPVLEWRKTVRDLSKHDTFLGKLITGYQWYVDSSNEKNLERDLG